MTEELFKKALKECKNYKEVFDTCNKFYDTENATIGIITKAAIANNIGNLIKASGAKLRK